MTYGFKELREELEKVFRYEERYRETGYIHPDVENWEDATWRNRSTILAALQIAERGDWVRCEERMPEERVTCLVWGPKFTAPEPWEWMGENFAINVSRFDLPSHKEITHWTKLPLPPEEK